MPDLDLFDPFADPVQASQLLDADTPALRAIARDTVQRPRVTSGRALALTRSVKQALAPQMPRVLVELAPEPAALRQAQFGRIMRKAIVYVAADQRATVGAPSTTAGKLADLKRRVIAADAYLVRFAIAHFQGEDAADAELDLITPGTGHVDSANDVLRLHTMFTTRWDRVAGRTEVTLEYLAQAERDATTLLALELPEPERQAQDLEHRAYTAWVEDYTDLARTGRYLGGLSRAIQRLFPAPFEAHQAKPEPKPAPGPTTPADPRPA